MRKDWFPNPAIMMIITVKGKEQLNKALLIYNLPSCSIRSLLYVFKQQQDMHHYKFHVQTSWNYTVL